jgi:uncharacterized membrane protein HdeD (DUF308 family)
MLKTIFKKWWVILLQGILLIILGIYVMRYPAKMLVSLSLWIGILTLIAGAIGLFGYLGAEKEERETTSLWWSILTVLLGLLMLGNLLATMKFIIIFFGAWVTVTGVFLIKQGLEIKKQNGFGWVVLIIGAIAAVAGIMMAFNLVKGAIGISLFLGLQAIMLGVDFIFIGLLKRKFVKKLT